MSGQPTHPGRTRCPPIPLTFTGPRLFTPQWSLSENIRGRAKRTIFLQADAGTPPKAHTRVRAGRY